MNRSIRQEQPLQHHKFQLSMWGMPLKKRQEETKKWRASPKSKIGLSVSSSIIEQVYHLLELARTRNESRATKTVRSTRNPSRWELMKTNYILTVHAKIHVRTGLWVLSNCAQRILVLVLVSSCPDRPWKWNRQPSKWAKKQASIQENKQNMTQHHRANADKQI